MMCFDAIEVITGVDGKLNMMAVDCLQLCVVAYFTQTALNGKFKIGCWEVGIKFNETDQGICLVSLRGGKLFVFLAFAPKLPAKSHPKVNKPKGAADPQHTMTQI